MSFFGNAINAIAKATKRVTENSGVSAPSLPLDLQKLEHQQAGLAERARSYINGTGDPDVLSALAQGRHGRLYAGLSVSRNDNPGVFARRQLFFDPALNTDAVIRYMQVLAADQNPAKQAGLKATDAVPASVKIFLNELYFGKKNLRSADDSLPDIQNDRLMTVIEGLGGTAEDLFDVAFFKDRKWPHRKSVDLDDIVDLPSLTRTYPDAFLAQSKRLPIFGRLKMLEHLSDNDQLEEPPFDRLVIDGLGEKSKVIRTETLKHFVKTDPIKREKLATELLATGSSAMRESMVEVLTGIPTETAKQTLETHLKTEKTARIRGTIEDYLAVSETSDENGDEAAEQITSYDALDGTTVTIPSMRVPKDGPAITVTETVHAELLALGKEHEATYQRDLTEAEKNGGSKSGNKYYLNYASSIAPEVFVEAAESFLLGNTYDRGAVKGMYLRIDHPKTTEVFRAILGTCAPKPALDTSLRFIGGNVQGINTYSHRKSPWAAVIRDYLESDDADYRYLDMMSREYGAHRSFPTNEKRDKRPMKPGEQLYYLYVQQRNWYDRHDEGPAHNVVWQLVAENLWIVDRALGIVADVECPENLLAGLRMLRTLPKVPAKYGPALLSIALSGPKAAQKLARSLLNHNDGFDALLINLIDDNRQDVRAGAAKWLGERNFPDATKPIQKRLKKEKSPVARAAMVFALQALGEDISTHVGPAALLSEAEKNLPKASFKGVEWLNPDHIPAMQYRDGSAVPLNVLRWWIALAVKLKAPGEADLFELYLDQLKPEDAIKLSTWFFDSWYAFDTAPPEEAIVEASAQKQFAVFSRHWQVYFEHLQDATDEQKLEFLRRRLRAETPNSGSASKGILALTSKMPPIHGVAKVRSYLRKHGGRTSQTTALLELMAAMGDPVSLQVVIAAATRLRQKGVQKRANELIQIVADRNDWTLDQLADRTVPTGGLEDDGRMELPCAGGDKIYVAQLDEKFGLTLVNPDGKVVKSLPAGQDEETKAAKKALTAAKKEIKQAIDFQSMRLFEAMCSDRSWQVEDFNRDFLDHPLMRKLVERLIWQGLDANGNIAASFRPTPEGEMINAGDQDIDLSGFDGLRLAHASTLSEEDASAWRQHMKDYEVTPLFDQVREDLPRLTPEMGGMTDIEDRKGWVTDCFTIRGEAKRAGYERGSILDSGGFDTYTRHFSGVGIIAVVEFSGSGVPEENWPAAYKSLFFERLPMGQQRGYGSGQKLRLDKVPAVLLAECWADLHKMSAKAAYVPDWEKVSPW